MAHQITKLDNGITVLSENIEYVRTISIGAWVKAGSRDDPKQLPGLAHFLEHMLFKGTKTRSKFEIAHYLESRGGAMNAYTSREYTTIYARILASNLKDAIEIISDIILNSRFREPEIEKEKTVVLDEIQDSLDTPTELIHNKFYEKIFPEHPLSHQITGKAENIKNIEKDDLINFVKNNYTTDNLIISASGLLDHAKLVRFVKKAFADLPRSSKKTSFEKIPAVKEQTFTFSNKSNKQNHICTGVQTFAFDDERRLPLLVLNSIFSAGMSSRFFQNIREKHGITYALSSFTDFYMDTGCFYIYCSSAPKNTDKCLELIREELNKISKNSITDSELATVKALLKSSLVMALESTSSRMNRLAKQYMYSKNITPIDEVVEKINSVKKEDIFRLAKELFQQINFVTTILKS